MIRILAVCCAVLALWNPPAGAQSDSPAAGFEQAARDWLAPLVDNRDFSGVILIRHGEAEPVALTFGYADWVSGAPMAASARFPVGSITKSLTVAMARRLIDEGRLSADAPVSRYIPELTGYAGVRVGDIINHTAGLTRDMPADALPDARSDTLVAWLAGQTPPGPGPHEYAYSNLGYGILAVVIERVVNARFETLIASEFLVPLGMNDSRLVRGNARHGDNVPAGYAAGPLPLDLRAPMPDVPAPGASGLVAPMADLLRLAEAVRTRRVDLFEADGSLTGSWSVNLVNGEAIYTIQGSVPGYSAGISILPTRDLTIVYGTNIDSYSNWGLREVLHALAQGRDPGPPNLRPSTHGLTEAHLDGAGEYEGSPYGLITVQPVEGGLDLVLSERGWRFYLTPTGEEALNWRLFNVDLAFERDEAGRVSAMSAVERGLAGDPRRWRMTRTDLPPLPPVEPADNER
ncbi:serine hydrolase domain-containing protein [Maricaulis sp.]|uniref:serine hydrolase domain-containing protein n=1 Tax=Maricaulis sp. TaxID=1486257 RepID=UPI002B275A16|nr:serine hydrolase domain-containing protein [Maricaulis sp.]